MSFRKRNCAPAEALVAAEIRGALANPQKRLQLHLHPEEWLPLNRQVRRLAARRAREKPCN